MLHALISARLIIEPSLSICEFISEIQICFAPLVLSAPQASAFKMHMEPPRLTFDTRQRSYEHNKKISKNHNIPLDQWSSMKV
jgi:hypothetical protein